MFLKIVRPKFNYIASFDLIAAIESEESEKRRDLWMKKATTTETG